MKILITEAALKQLESAIFMYAYDFDEVAVHIVASAAFELCVKRLEWGNYQEETRKMIRPDKIKEYFNLINKPTNFFKHGSHRNEPLGYIDYNQGSAEHLILNASLANLSAPAEYRLKCAHIFANYFSIKHPELVVDKSYTDAFKELQKKFDISDEFISSKKSLRIWLDTIESPIMAK